jgi:hypothetical protein
LACCASFSSIPTAAALKTMIISSYKQVAHC